MRRLVLRPKEGKRELPARAVCIRRGPGKASAVAGGAISTDVRCREGYSCTRESGQGEISRPRTRATPAIELAADVLSANSEAKIAEETHRSRRYV